MEKQESSAVDAKYVIDLKGRRYVRYAGLLDLAHRMGLKSLEAKVIQFPSAANGNLTIAEATATFPGADGDRVFSEVGDCGPANCTPAIALHAPRMACTRAKGRALRDALCIEEVMVEEMHSLDDDAPTINHGAPRAPQRARHDPEDQRAAKASENACEWPQCQTAVTPQQARISQEFCGRRLCPDHEAQLRRVRSEKGHVKEGAEVTVERNIGVEADRQAQEQEA